MSRRNAKPRRRSRRKWDAAYIAEHDAEFLYRELVQEFVSGLGMHAGGSIEGFIRCVEKIADKRKTTQEDVYRSIRQEALALGGYGNVMDLPGIFN